MISYDKAHDLAKVLSASTEYQALSIARKLLETDESAKKMVKDFMVKQMELQMEVMSGKPEDKAKTEAIQKMLELLKYNPKAWEFIQAHFRFQQIMADVYKIINDAVGEGMDLFGKQ